MSLFDKLFKKNSAGNAPAVEEPEKKETTEETPVVDGPQESEKPAEGKSMTGSDMIDQMFIKDFYSNESTFRNQAWQFPRFSREHPATLGETLSVLFEGMDKAFKSLRVLSEWGTVKEDDDPRSIAGTQLFPLLLDGESRKGTAFRPNIVLLVGLDDSFPVKEVVLHLKVKHLIPDRCYCMRVSLMEPDGKGEEALRCCRPGTDDSIMGGDFCHYSTSFLIIQDNGDMSELLSEYEACEASMQQKEKRGEELDDLEKKISEGRWELKDPNHSVGYGRWLMGQERWFDAYRQLVRIFRTLQRFILNEADDSDQVKAYVGLAFDIGRCLHRMGRRDEAYYYLSLAAGRMVEARPEYSEILAEMMDVRASNEDSERMKGVREAAFEATSRPYAPKALSVGFMMQELFRAPEGSLTSIAVFRDSVDTVEYEQDARKTWDYPVFSLAEDGVTAVIGFSPVTYITKNEADKSILVANNSVIVRVKKAATGKDDHLFRFFVMIPPASFDSDKQFAMPENIPEGESFIVGNANKDGCPDEVTPQMAGSFAHALGRACRFLEAFGAARFAIDYFKSRWENLDDDARSAFADTLYLAGVCVMDFKYPEKANYYLSIAAEAHVMQFMQEYINSLANAHDPRTLPVIDHAISMEMEESADAEAVERWRLFLKRRKAYILTDAQRFVEAEILLQELLNSSDEVTRNFAASELRYVIDEKRKNGIQ